MRSMVRHAMKIWAWAALVVLLAVPVWAQEPALAADLSPDTTTLTELLKVEREVIIKDIRIWELQVTVWEREKSLEEMRLTQRIAAFEARVLEKMGRVYDVLEDVFAEPEIVGPPVPEESSS